MERNYFPLFFDSTAALIGLILFLITFKTRKKLLFLSFLYFVVPVGISPVENLGCYPPEGKPAATQSPCRTLKYQVHAGPCCVSIILRTPVSLRKRAYVIILMRAYTNGGCTLRQRVSTTYFARKKLSQIVLVLLMQTGFEPWIFAFH